MNPLVNSDVDRYVKDLIDHHIQNEDQEENARNGTEEKRIRRPGSHRPADAGKGRTA